MKKSRNMTTLLLKALRAELQLRGCFLFPDDQRTCFPSGVNSSPYAYKKASTLPFSDGKGESGKNLDGESMINTSRHKAQGTSEKRRAVLNRKKRQAAPFAYIPSSALDNAIVPGSANDNYSINVRATAVASSQGPAVSLFPDLDSVQLASASISRVPLVRGCSPIFWTLFKSLIDQKSALKAIWLL